jgi:hypothetical protein
MSPKIWTLYRFYFSYLADKWLFVNQLEPINAWKYNDDLVQKAVKRFGHMDDCGPEYKRQLIKYAAELL